MDISHIAQVKYPSFSSGIVNTYYESSVQKYLSNPYTYSLALGLWWINLGQDTDVVDMGEEYGIIHLISKSRLNSLFLVTATHYMKIRKEAEMYRSISKDDLPFVLDSLKVFLDEKIEIVYKLINKVDPRIMLNVIRYMHNMTVIWTTGFLMGWYGKKATEILDFLIGKNVMLNVIQETIDPRQTQQSQQSPLKKAQTSGSSP